MNSCTSMVPLLSVSTCNARVSNCSAACEFFDFVYKLMSAHVIEDVGGLVLVDGDADLTEEWPELEECERAALGCECGECGR